LDQEKLGKERMEKQDPDTPEITEVENQRNIKVKENIQGKHLK
jgi:hypothetical protein